MGPPKSPGYAMTYRLSKRAPPSYDIILNGVIVASLVWEQAQRGRLSCLSICLPANGQARSQKPSTSSRRCKLRAPGLKLPTSNQIELQQDERTNSGNHTEPDREPERRFPSWWIVLVGRLHQLPIAFGERIITPSRRPKSVQQRCASTTILYRRTGQTVIIDTKPRVSAGCGLAREKRE